MLFDDRVVNLFEANFFLFRGKVAGDVIALQNLAAFQLHPDLIFHVLDLEDIAAKVCFAGGVQDGKTRIFCYRVSFVLETSLWGQFEEAGLMDVLS